MQKRLLDRSYSFINKDDHLNKAHIKYLKSRFFEIANEVGRYFVMNTQQPKKSVISEVEEAEMEEFIDNVKIIISALGHKVFELLMPINSKEQLDLNQGDDEIEYLYIKNKTEFRQRDFKVWKGL